MTNPHLEALGQRILAKLLGRLTAHDIPRERVHVVLDEAKEGLKELRTSSYRAGMEAGLQSLRTELTSMKIIVMNQSMDWRVGHSQGVKNSVQAIDEMLEELTNPSDV